MPGPIRFLASKSKRMMSAARTAARRGRVDDEQVFYAMTRGFTRGEAVRMIVAGFFQQVFDRITIESVRDALGRSDWPAGAGDSGSCRPVIAVETIANIVRFVGLGGRRSPGCGSRPAGCVSSSRAGSTSGERSSKSLKVGFAAAGCRAAACCFGRLWLASWAHP